MLSSAKFFNSRKLSPYKSHHLVDTFMKYNVLVLRLQITTDKDELKKKKEKKKKEIYILVESVGSVGSHMILQSYTILHDLTYDPIIFTILVRF